MRRCPVVDDLSKQVIPGTSSLDVVFQKDHSGTIEA